jgi:hypothetical protein
MSCSKMIALNRKMVEADYQSAVTKNEIAYLNGDVYATEKYVFPNQERDARLIVKKFYERRNLYAIIVQKRIKVGALRMMIEVMRLACTHPDDDFVISPQNVFVITGMSNVAWQNDFANCVPECFRKNVKHRARLNRLSVQLERVRNALIIIDEIDTGEKPEQTMHKLLKEAKLTDVNQFIERNVRFLFVSATVMKHIHDMSDWQDLHERMTMTIPDNYIGHRQFLEMGIAQEYYPLKDANSVDKWLTEDVLDYGEDFRVHLVRLTNKNTRLMREGCHKLNIKFVENNSDCNISEDELKRIFLVMSRKKHVVLSVKGRLRRSDFIPNVYKLRVGAAHEGWTKKKDYNALVQGLIGRMTGYDWLIAGHRTGPFRYHLDAIRHYEACYDDPFGKNNYQSSGFKMVNGKIKLNKPVLISKGPIANLPGQAESSSRTIQHSRRYSETDRGYKIFTALEEAQLFAINVLKMRSNVKLISGMEKQKLGDFYTTNLPTKGVYSLSRVIDFITDKNGVSKVSLLPTHSTADEVGKILQRTLMCYEDERDASTFRLVLLWARLESL